MRKELFGVDSFVHVYNRGNRKQPIVRDEKDRWRFLQSLYYFNSKISIANPFQILQRKKRLRFDLNHNFIWPEEWPMRQPIVKIINFSLLENHYHLLLKEIARGGITIFMKKLGNGMTGYFNTKYQETGRLFQGSYKAKVVDKDSYLQYLSVYIQVKNIFDLYPGGFEKAIKEFDKAYEWAIQYPFCSLADYVGKRNSLIIDKDILGDIFFDPKEYKEFVWQCIATENFDEKLKSIKLD
ncbi:MAG: transposase [Patescibacteria group bacterium]